MKFWTFLIFFLVICFNQLVSGAEKDLSLELIGEKRFTVEPRNIVTIVYRISNNTDLNQKFDAAVTLPPNWKVINPEHFYEIDRNQQKIQMLSIYIPGSAESGDYHISYQISTQSKPTIIRSLTIPVFVKPILKISLLLVEQPDYVIAGDTCRMKFRLINESNISTETKITVINRDSLSNRFKDRMITLAPAQSESFNLLVSTNIAIGTPITNNIEVTAHLLNNAEVQSVVLCRIEIIPRNLATLQNYNIIPVYTTLRYVNQNQYSQLSGLQGEILGKGFLNQSQTQKVNLILRGPDVYNKSIFGKYDKYLLSNSGDKYLFHIGDRHFYLSTLTQSSRYGRGIEGQYKHNNFRLGTYSMVSRFFQSQEKVFASFLEFEEKGKHQIRINYMKKNQDLQESDIVSVESKIVPNNNIKIQMEYALGKNNTATRQAYYLDIQGKLKNHTLYLKFIKADPDFAGYFSNVNFVSLGGAFRLNQKVRLDAGIGQQKYDANVTPSYYFSSFTKFQRLGLSYQLNSTSYLNVSWSTRIRYDQQSVSKIDDYEQNFRFYFSKILKKINFNTTVELKKTRDNIISESANFRRYTTSITFNPNSRHKFRGSLSYANEKDPIRENKRNLSAALRALIHLTGSTKLDLMLQSFNDLKYRSIIRDIYEIRLSQKLLNYHEISFITRHIAYSNNKLSNFSALIVEYRIPFGMPVSQKNTLGSLKGILLDSENNRPIIDAVIRLNNLSTVTNKKGEFKFPSLTPGKYILDLERSSIGLNKVPTESFPMELLIIGKDKKQISIKVARGASINGKVTLYKFKEIRPDGDKLFETLKKNSILNNQDRSYEEESGLANILIELQRGKEIKRRVTDQLGRFNFSELSPGEWKLFVQKSGLPEYTFVDQDTLQLFTNPGENKEIEIKVLPKKRPIRIIQDGGIVMEKPAADKIRSKDTGTDIKKDSKFIHHTTKSGDWLSKMALKYYGDAMLYPIIFEANKKTIKDPNLIFPEQIILIPVLN